MGKKFCKIAERDHVNSKFIQIACYEKFHGTLGKNENTAAAVVLSAIASITHLPWYVQYCVELIIPSI